MTVFNKMKGVGARALADDALFTALLILLVGVASFGLGRQSVGDKEPLSNAPGEAAVAAHATTAAVSTSTSTTGEAQYVGSKNSDKYHLLWCSGAKRISEANKVFFKSKEEAEGAGYKPAANCPGL